MDLTELYQDLILDHGKKPRNFGKCNKFNHDAEGHNPLCGDNIHVYLILDKEKNEVIFETKSLEEMGYEIDKMKVIKRLC